MRLSRSVWIAILAVLLAIPIGYGFYRYLGTASANSPELREEARDFHDDYRNQLKKHLRPSQLETLSSGSGCICSLLRDVRNADWASDECQTEARRLYRQLCSDEQNQCDGDQRDKDKDRDRDKDREKKKDKPRQRAEATPTDEPEDRDKDKDRKRRRRRPRATDEWPTPWAPSATPETINDPCEAFGLCTETPEPTNTRRPTRTPYPTDTEEGPAPTNTRRPTRTPYPTDTETPEPTNTRRPTRTPYPTDTDEPEPTARPSRTPTDDGDEPVACRAVKHTYRGERCHPRLNFDLPVVIDIENHLLPLPGDRPRFDENSILRMSGYVGYMYGEGAVWEYVGDDCTREYVKGRQDKHIIDRNNDPTFPGVIGVISFAEAEELTILRDECDLGIDDPTDEPEPTNTRRPTRTPYPTDTDEPEPTARATRTPRPTATEDGGGYPPPRSCESISPVGGEKIKARDGLDIPSTEWVQVEFWFDPHPEEEDYTEWTRLEAGPLDTGPLNREGRVTIWRYLKSDCTRAQIENDHIKPHHRIRQDVHGRKTPWADDPTWRRLLRQ